MTTTKHKPIGRPRRWNYHKCLQSAQRYNTLGAWASNDLNAYAAACRNGWRDQIIEAARLRRNKKARFVAHSYSGCLEVASKYTSLTEWSVNHIASYNVAGILRIRKKIALELGWKKPKSLQTKRSLRATGTNQG